MHPGVPKKVTPDGKRKSSVFCNSFLANKLEFFLLPYAFCVFMRYNSK